MEDKALIGYIAGRLTEVLKRTEIEEKTSGSDMASYCLDLRRTCLVIWRHCMSHIDGFKDSGTEDMKDR